LTHWWMQPPFHGGRSRGPRAFVHETHARRSHDDKELSMAATAGQGRTPAARSDYGRALAQRTLEPLNESAAPASPARHPGGVGTTREERSREDRLPRRVPRRAASDERTRWAASPCSVGRRSTPAGGSGSTRTTMIGAPEAAAQLTAAMAEVEPSKPTIRGPVRSLAAAGARSETLQAWASIDGSFHSV
jgi:hypothetical protein